MTFLSIILVLAFVQWRGSGAPLQRDGWFDRYLAWLPVSTERPRWRLLAATLVPAVVLWGLTWGLVEHFSVLWALLLAVPVLLYSLGRGDFTAQVGAYIEASEREDSVGAARQLAILQGAQGESADPEDWPEMHRQALAAIAYRGCERMFAVLFWFLLLGPAGALLYRLGILYREREDTGAVQRWLWLLEWPVVRLMGLTWSMAGNFDSCFFRCQRELLNVRESPRRLLFDQMLGALGSTESDCDRAPVGLDEVRASLPLFSRSLLLWVCVLAVATLLA